MADHPRKAIRARAISLLTGNITYNSQAVPIYQSRALPWFSVELPAIGVYMNEESSDDRESAPRINYRELLLVTEIVARETLETVTDDLFDAIAKQIEDIFAVDPYLNRTADDNMYTGMKIAMERDGDKIISGMPMSWKVEYRDFAPDPANIPLEDLDTANTKIDVNADENSRIEADQDLT